MSDADTTLPHHQRSRRYLIGGILTVTLVAVVFGVLFPRLADMRTVGHILFKLPASAWVPVFAAIVVNILSNAPTLQAVAPGLKIGRAFTISQSSQAISNTLPAGEPVASTIKYAMLRDAGIDGDRAAGAITADAMYVAIFRVGMPATAAAWAVANGARNVEWIAFVVVSVLLLAVMLGLLRAVLVSEAASVRFGRLIGRAIGRVKRHRDREQTKAHWVAAVHSFRAHTRSIVATRWHYSVTAMTVQQLSLFMAFLLSLRAFGIDDQSVSIVLAFTAFSVGRLLAMAAQVPAGIGVLDLGFVGILASGSAASADKVVAAVLLFRIMSWVPASAIGAVCIVGSGIARRRRLSGHSAAS